MSNEWFVVDAHNQFIPHEAIPKTKGTIADLTVEGISTRIFRSMGNRLAGRIWASAMP